MLSIQRIGRIPRPYTFSSIEAVIMSQTSPYMGKSSSDVRDIVLADKLLTVCRMNQAFVFGWY